MKVLFALLAMFLISPVVAFANGNDCWGLWGMGHMMNFGYGGMFMGILWLVLIGVVIYLIIQGAKSKTGTGSTGESPIDILKKRYAKGEVTKEEYDKIKKDLEG